MKTKVTFSILVVLVLVLMPRATEAAKAETASVDIAKYELRLRKVEQRLEKLDSPIQQMGPESSDNFESGVNDIQLSFDDVSEKLAMIRFVMNREGSAPQDKRELAQAELEFMEADIADLEDQSSSLSNEVDDVVWY